MKGRLKMDEIKTRESIKIENMIYEIRGKQIILDSDLAKLYEVETKRINEAVRNNPDKFPERFSFKLTEEESEIFLVENFDQKIEKRGGRYTKPRVFTEQGVAMLATILKSKTAVKVSIVIMDAFVLDLIRNIDVNITLIVKNKSLLTKTDINKYNSQYNNLNIVYNDSFHDRYFILDNDVIYHCGTSINHAGSKTFSINKLEYLVVKKSLLNRINEVINVKCK